MKSFSLLWLLAVVSTILVTQSYASAVRGTRSAEDVCRAIRKSIQDSFNEEFPILFEALRKVLLPKGIAKDLESLQDEFRAIVETMILGKLGAIC